MRTMVFKAPLERGVLVRRYKRFLADVVLADGTETTAHVPNPGAMLGLTAPGLPAWLSRSADPKRKLPLTLEMVEIDGRLVGVNTMNPNRIAEAAIADEASGERLALGDLPIRLLPYDRDAIFDSIKTFLGKGL